MRTGTEDRARTLINRRVKARHKWFPKPVYFELAETIRALLDEGADEPRVSRALAAWDGSGGSPDTLRSYVEGAP